MLTTAAHAARRAATRALAPAATRSAASLPAVAEDALPTDASSDVPRWRRELGVVRTDWTRDEISAVYNTPLLDLVHAAATVHRTHHNPSQVQRCTLLSVKTGGCPEDCGYCSQSSNHKTETEATKLLDLDTVFEAAVRAKAAGSTRFCMGAAWRGPDQVGPRQWARVLDMVTKVRGLGLEVCATLGMVNAEQAGQLRDAGLSAYNHNVDTSPEHYAKITSTRTYADRLATLAAVREAGVSVCAGGIIGLGESGSDRVGLLHTLSTLPAHPESVPINALVAVPGTPLQNAEPPTPLDVVRCVATARITMPRSMVRLSAGRRDMGAGDQALAFLAGANSIFDGDKLLTTANADRADDEKLFETLGLTSRPAFLGYGAGGETSKHGAEAKATA